MADSNVYQRLSQCKKLVAEATFSKRKSDGLKYPYLPMETIQPVVEDAMNEAGLVLVPGELRTKNIRDPWDAASAGGFGTTRWFHIQGELPLTWVNIDSPSDTIRMVFYGEAKDNSDKVISKIYTAIMKSAYKAIFNISTDRKDDPDNTEDEKAIEDAERKKNAPQSPPEGYEYNLMGKLVKKAEPQIVTTLQPKPTEAEVVMPQQEVPATEITADRPIEEMVTSIIKYNRQSKLRPIVQECARKWGEDPAFWREEQVKECYLRCVEGGRN